MWLFLMVVGIALLLYLQPLYGPLIGPFFLIVPGRTLPDNFIAFKKA
jgi:hypothetical protein